jgi:hypothetical protein
LLLLVASYADEVCDKDAAAQSTVAERQAQLISAVTKVTKANILLRVGSWVRFAGLRIQPLAKLPHETLWPISKPPTAGSSAADTIIQDTDADIPGYFDQLIAACGAEANTPGWYAACFGRIRNLSLTARCTTRMDSQHCGGTGDSAKPLGIFTNSTQNIVILGAGPVGLHLASMLVEYDPQIKIVIFENRLDAPGRKRPYQRGWLTELPFFNFRGVIDPKVVEVLSSLHGSDWVKESLPLNIVELLLLLSNRRRGVQFVFGDYRDYRADLLRTPNLVAFDATGHHLGKLPKRHPAPDEILKWSHAQIRYNGDSDDGRLLQAGQRVAGKGICALHPLPSTPFSFILTLCT